MSHSADSTQIDTSLLPLAPAVYFIGAGPGDPDLLTVKALKILQRADVIVFADSLVPKQILQGVRLDAEIVRTGSKTLEEIVPLMLERVRSHKSVVRLHSGDLSLYSAIHEQIQALVEAEIPFELIPGISAFQAATAKLGVELTVPGLVQTIILTRISGRASAVPESEELASLAAHQASLCLYLSARHVEDAQAKLLEHYPVDTPVAVCFRIGWPDEKIWLIPLAEMAAITQKENLIRTTLYLVSPALRTVATSGAQSTVVSKELERLPSLGVSGAATQEPARSRLYHPEHSHLFRSSGYLKKISLPPSSLQLPPTPYSLLPPHA